MPRRGSWKYGEIPQTQCRTKCDLVARRNSQHHKQPAISHHDLAVQKEQYIKH